MAERSKAPDSGKISGLDFGASVRITPSSREFYFLPSVLLILSLTLFIIDFDT